MKTLKTILVIVLSVTACSTLYASASEISLKTALEKKQVKLKINGSSKHFGKCLNIEIRNLTNIELSLNLETGRQIINSNDTFQNMIITNQLSLILKPNKADTFSVYAMCISPNHRTPIKKNSFHFGEMAKGYLLTLTKLIDKHHFQDAGAQDVVWKVVKNELDTNEFKGKNKFETDIMRRFILLAKDGKVITADLFLNETDLLQTKTPENTISGEIKWNMEMEGFTTANVYDEQGNFVTCIFMKKIYSEGEHKYNFLLVSSAIKPDKKYIVKIIIKDQVLQEIACVGKVTLF